MAEINSSLEKALKVLDIFQLKDRVTLTEAAQDTGYSITAISRILNTLEVCNYIFQDKLNGGYYLTDKLFVLGRNTSLQNQLVNVIDESIGDLSKTVGFTVTVSVREGNQSVIIIKKSPQNAIALSFNGRETISLNATATGKILTAFSHDPDELMDQIEFVRLTPKTITDRDQFIEAITEAKGTGLAYDVEEVTEGLVCVAAPVLDVRGEAICAISVSGYKERIFRQLYQITPKLQETARTCGQLLS